MSKTLKPLGKIKKVDLREVWPHEAINFTKWLAEEENLSRLGEEIGIELELIEAESSVGSFNTDIYAKEVGTGKKVIVENQLETTNHDHLGKIITYAAGKDAEIIVWLVPKAREEHRKAIEWLNQHTDMEIDFFLIEMELWSIDGSNPALMFNIAEQPNNWAKVIKFSEDMSDTGKVKLQYWQMYNEIANNDVEFRKVFSPTKVSAHHWSNLAVGSSKYHIALLLNTNKNGKIGVEICVPDNKKIGEFFIEHKLDFETVLNVEGEVYNAAKASGIRFYMDNCNVKTNPEKWEEYIRWQMEKALAIKAILDGFVIPE